MGQYVHLVDDDYFAALLGYLERVPAIRGGIGHGVDGEAWWVKFVIATTHPLAWSAVQEFAHVLNYLSLADRLPTVFKPVSPPPYLNGGPNDYLSWVIESPSTQFTPALCAEWLEANLPRPVEDLQQWQQADPVD